MEKVFSCTFYSDAEVIEKIEEAAKRLYPDRPISDVRVVQSHGYAFMVGNCNESGIWSCVVNGRENGVEIRENKNGTYNVSRDVNGFKDVFENLGSGIFYEGSFHGDPISANYYVASIFLSYATWARTTSIPVTGGTEAFPLTLEESEVGISESDITMEMKNQTGAYGVLSKKYLTFASHTATSQNNDVKYICLQFRVVEMKVDGQRREMLLIDDYFDAALKEIFGFASLEKIAPCPIAPKENPVFPPEPPRGKVFLNRDQKMGYVFVIGGPLLGVPMILVGELMTGIGFSSASGSSTGSGSSSTSTSNSTLSGIVSGNPLGYALMVLGLLLLCCGILFGIYFLKKGKKITPVVDSARKVHDEWAAEVARLKAEDDKKEAALPTITISSFYDFLIESRTGKAKTRAIEIKGVPGSCFSLRSLHKISKEGESTGAKVVETLFLNMPIAQVKIDPRLREESDETGYFRVPSTFKKDQAYVVVIHDKKVDLWEEI